MSNGWIILIPEDPRYVPDGSAQRRACERLAEISRDADRVCAMVSEKVEFFDAGANFERVCCRSCGSALDIAWWRRRMDGDFTGGFALAPLEMPCCGATQTLDELVYEWNAGFARFALEVPNANIAVLDDEHRRELEVILGTPLRVIYRHL